MHAFVYMLVFRTHTFFNCLIEILHPPLDNTHPSRKRDLDPPLAKIKMNTVEFSYISFNLNSSRNGKFIFMLNSSLLIA